MTTRINPDGPRATIEVSSTQYRVTPRPARPFSALLGSGANAVIQGAEAAARHIPGGPEIVAAVRDPGPGYSAGGPSGGRRYPGEVAGAGAYPGSGPIGAEPTLEGYSANAGTNPAGASATGSNGAGSNGTGANGIEGALAQQAQDSLYLLGVQQRIQDESRNFQLASNVLKTHHESVKNAIGNLR
jgi:hypothetical protein